MNARRSGTVALLAGSLAAALALVGEAFEQPYATGFGDYDVFHLMWEAARTTVLAHGELPLWNPYVCGGMPEWGYGNSQVFHPLFLLALPLGSTLGLKVFLLLHAAAGVAGTFLLARVELGLRRGPAAFTAALFAGTGFFAWHCGLGHANFIPFYLLPWLVLAWRRAARDRRHGVSVAAVLALALLGGGGYPFAFFALVLAFEAGATAVEARRRLATASTLAVASGLTLLLGAPRLLPVLVNVTRYPKVVRETDHASPLEVLVMWTDRATEFDGLPWRDHSWSFVEYGCYLGVATLLLAAVGAVCAGLGRGRRRLVVGALAFTTLALGAFAPWAPWALLAKLPVFESLQVPSRWMIVSSFYVVLLSGLGLQRLLDAAAARATGLRLAVAVAALVVVADVWAVHRAIVDGRWSREPVEVEASSPRFVLTSGPQSPVERRAARYPARPRLPGWNVGTGHCYTGMGYRPAFGLWVGDLPQVRAVPGDAVEIVERDRTATSWRVTARVDRPTRLVFNQTWEQDWVATPGPAIADLGRLAVDLPPGVHDVELRYRPRSLPWALAALALGLAISALLLRRRARAGPWLAVLVGLAAIPVYLALARAPFEPWWEPLEIVRADGVRPGALIDLNPDSAWYLESVPGTIEVGFAPRPLSWVGVLNGREHPRDDMAAADVLVTAYDGDRVVGARQIRFPGPPRAQQRIAVRLEVPRADRLGLRVQTHHGRTGALSRLDLDTTRLVGPPIPAAVSVVDAVRQGLAVGRDVTPEVGRASLLLHPNGPRAPPATVEVPFEPSDGLCFTAGLRHHGPRGDGATFVVGVRDADGRRVEILREHRPASSPDLRVEAPLPRAVGGSPATLVLTTLPGETSDYDWATLIAPAIGPCPPSPEVFRAP